jgi:4-amino-4-deoxy-L-arabinose transferase-like glycosyltransferase
VVRTERPDDAGAADGIPEFAARPVLAIGGATVALLLLFAARDGYHRDELYFLAASRHLALGYVDQPPLAIIIAGLSRVLFGHSVFGLRLIPALLDGVTVVFAGLIARELGGWRVAQVLGSLMVAVGGYLVIAHIAGPSIYDLAFWACGRCIQTIRLEAGPVLAVG